MRLFASCARGLEDLLDAELSRLGATDRAIASGGVFFAGDLATLYRANLELRVASRVQRVLLEGEARSVRELDAAIAGIDVASLVRKEHGIAVEMHDAHAPPQEVVARARRMEDALNVALGARTDRVSDHRARLVVHRHRARLVVGLDASGKALHKRGWRGESRHEAPVQETLAAALLAIAGYDGSGAFLDPFCGSGTIAIEAAYVALDKPPLIHRSKGEFAFEWWKGFEHATWRRIQEAARARRKPAPAHPIVAADVDVRSVASSLRHAEKARVGHQMRFVAADARMPALKDEPAFVVANLPYGRRIGDARALERMYAEFGRVLAERFATATVALLVPDEPWTDALGLAVERKVRNGAIDCAVRVRHCRRPTEATAQEERR